MLNVDDFAQGMSAFGPRAAFGFLCLAVALLFLDNPKWPWRVLSRGCALCAALLGATRGFEFWAGRPPSLDQFLFRLSVWPLHPGRMAPVTALNLVLTGMAILLLDWRWKRFSVSQLLTWITVALSFLTLTIHTYDPGAQYRARMFFQGSPYISLAFLLLCTAILFARPERGVAGIVLRRDLGGEVARRLLPAVIFLPFSVSLLIVRMYQAGVYGSVLMVFLFVLAPVAVFVPLVLMGANLLSGMEIERRRSEEQLRISTQRFSSVVESAMDAIITLDQDQHVIVFNQAAEKMFGCFAWDVLGKPLDRFLPGEFRMRPSRARSQVR